MICGTDPASRFTNTLTAGRTAAAEGERCRERAVMSVFAIARSTSIGCSVLIAKVRKLQCGQSVDRPYASGEEVELQP